MMTEIEIKVRIIRKLVKWRKWGGSHTENVLRGLPSHLRGEKVTKNALKELVKEEMEGAVKLLVPIKVSVQYGKNWLEMEE